MFTNALRALRRRPAYALMSVALLAVGIGTATAIFSIVDVALLRPLPYANPDRLLWLEIHQPSAHDSGTTSGLVPLQMVRWREHGREFLAGIEGAEFQSRTLIGAGDPEVLTGINVTAGLFHLLGVSPALGRDFNTTEEYTGSNVAIVSDAFWQSHMASDRNAVGRTLVIDGTPRAIVGVMPRDFRPFFVPVDVFVPLPLEPAMMGNTYRATIAIGRLKPDATIPQVVASLDRVNDAIAVEAPYYKSSRAVAQALRDALFGSTRKPMLVTAAAVLLLLAIAVTNVMNLTLSDAIARRQNTMTRLALGARPGMLVASRLLETATLVVIAAVVGLIVGRAALATLQAVNPAFFSGLGPLRLDARVIVFTAVISVLIGAMAVLPAALAESRFDIATIASAAARAIGSRTEDRVREILLAGQVAIVVLLLFAAALIARNLRSLGDTPKGFDPAQLVAIRMPGISSVTAVGERAHYLSRLVDAVRGVPGVVGASASQVQFALGSSSRTFLAIEGVQLPDSSGVVVNIRHAMPDAFVVMKSRVLSGRPLDATDADNGRPVAVVNASFARTFLGGHAEGTRIRRTASPTFQWMEIVGVVEDAQDAGVGVALGPTIYVPYLQENQPTAAMTILARLQPGLTVPERALRRAIADAGPTQAINRVALVADLERESTSQPRFQLLLIGLFGVGALVLVVGGIYAVTWHAVLRRTRELAVRSALGATPRALVTDSVRRGLRPVLGGSLVGLLAAYPAVQLMQSALGDQIHAGDVMWLIEVLVVVIAATGVAALIPARRALQIPAATALRA